ncbi:hypothetical protein JOD43_000062 [Pullulanibacillus pueri]|uniref:GPP34 family phosphoprotein n=1 Tax=Pullulanibacillus pueri TaxID=1437324 RepID=A0A8J2ZR70_9BACL|nr:GPP34 family phosphoprotein [Pullulanibacillus pueri]MBM7679903.1 hypothetical protein [Pullulanibacillus pueri]GGH73408.1 GPP34 family phosphoprotein [Pullulanibacillus pueri]
MLTLAEELLLVAYDDEKGTVLSSASFGLPYGIAGAVLMELALLGAVKYEDKVLTFLDDQNIKDPILRQLFNYLKQKDQAHSRRRKIKYWVEKLGRQIKSKKVRQLFLERLQTKGILVEKERPYFLLFTRKVYPSAGLNVEANIRQKIRDVVLNDEDPEVRTLMLIALLKACEAIKVIFSKAEYKAVKKKIDIIVKEQPYGKAVSDTIRAMQAAIMTSVAAASVAANSSSSSN